CLRIRRELTMLGIERDLQVLAQRAGAHRGCGVAEVHRAARLEPRDHPEGLAVLAPPDDDALVVGGHGGPAWLVAAGEGRVLTPQHQERSVEGERSSMFTARPLVPA